MNDVIDVEHLWRIFPLEMDFFFAREFISLFGVIWK